MKPVRFAVLIPLAFAAPAAADDDDYEADKYGPALIECYKAAGDRGERLDCLGSMAQTCMEAEEGGYSTLGMSRCHHGEGKAWDRFLNAEYRETMTSMKALDADEAESFPEFARRAEALKAAQRAWIGWRDANCEMDYALWGSGSMRHIAGTECVMRMTAERAVELIDLREAMQ